MNKDLKYNEVSVFTRKLLAVVHTSGERIEVDGQEAVLLMKKDFGLCTVSHGKKCTAVCASQNREINLTHTELHII
jgi:hypothetical protein